jgi:CheY-like chemotaxis protein
MSLILVIDDMAAVREPIAACLRLEGYQTACAANGAAALAAVHRARPALILLDISMPVMDGIAFLTALRSQPDTAGVPVILLTADGDRAKVLEAAKLGAKHYLLKSQFALPELLKRVREQVAAALPANTPPAGPAGRSSAA